MAAAALEFLVGDMATVPPRLRLPSMVVPWAKNTAKLLSPWTWIEELCDAEVVVVVPTVVVVAISLKVIGAKKVFPPATTRAALTEPVPRRLTAPILKTPAEFTRLPALVSTRMPVAVEVLVLLMAPALDRKLLELIVTAGALALMSICPFVSMVMLPSAAVVTADLLSVVTSVSARTPWAAAPARSAAMAAESIKRCLFKVRSLLSPAKGQNGLSPRPTPVLAPASLARFSRTFQGGFA